MRATSRRSDDEEEQVGCGVDAGARAGKGVAPVGGAVEVEHEGDVEVWSFLLADLTASPRPDHWCSFSHKSIATPRRLLRAPRPARA